MANYAGGLARRATLIACSWLALIACDSKTHEVEESNTTENDDATTQADPSSHSNTTRSTGSAGATTTAAMTAATNTSSARTSATPIDTSASVTSADVALGNTTTSGGLDAAVPTTDSHETSGTTPPVDDTTDAGSPNATSGEQALERCNDANLIWRTGHKTNYESYPDPGSEECIEFNGCYWAGMFAACDDKMPEEWVQTHNIVAVFPLEDLALHDLCLRRGNDVTVVTAYDTCGDDDCDGCCTENRGSADALIDLEKYTNERWGLPDGDIEWADLGPTVGDGCD